MSRFYSISFFSAMVYRRESDCDLVHGHAQILAELATQCASHLDCLLVVESLGGVEAAKRVRAGERFDLVFLADDALASLESDGCLLSGSRRPLMRSEVVLAVAAGSLRRSSIPKRP